MFMCVCTGMWMFVCACMWFACMWQRLVYLCACTFVWFLVHLYVHIPRDVVNEIVSIVWYWVIPHYPSHNTTPVFMMLHNECSQSTVHFWANWVLFGETRVSKEMGLTWIRFSSFLLDIKYLSKYISLHL